MPDSSEENTHDPASERATSPTAPDAVAAPARDADPVLLDAVDLARDALLDVTERDTIGDVVGHTVDDDNVVSLRFESRLDGYPGWLWIVTLARVDDGAPTVVESELMPGDSALLAPDWVPWSERLAEYRAQQKEAARDAAENDDGDDDTDDDDDDEENGARLHAGDLDGVDVDELDDRDAPDGTDDNGTDDNGSDGGADGGEGETDSNRGGNRGSRRGGTRGRRRSRGRRRG